MAQQNTLRASIEARAILLQASLKTLKGHALKRAYDQLERLLSQGDRLAVTAHDAFRSHQLALAMVDGITAKRVPSHCESLAQRIGRSLQAAAQA